MKIKQLLATIALAFMAVVPATAQDAVRNCGTTEYHQHQLASDPGLANRMEDIENFTRDYIQNNDGGERAVITIPVVFHVVYNTSAQNISDARIQAQLNQLNLDFARLNTDAGNTPAAFQGLAANTQIQFCMAQRTPAGVATTGIERRQTTVTSFSSNNAVKYYNNGGLNAWDATKYLNIWVCNLGSGLLGYAQFPGGSTATDGVVVLYSSVGSMLVPGTATNYALGRTATHEVGHWLNLRHIWGDANCGSDLVNDTPTQQTSNGGCPSFPHVTCSNGPNGDMFMNYMDYTYDACMNMFTTGQSSRMNALFVSGGARFSITTSNGCTPVGQVGCGTPSGLGATNITQTSATLNWTAVSGATGYNIQYRAVGSSSWNPGVSSTNSYALTGLTASTSYEFQVQAVCGETSGNYSATSTFTTAGTTPSCGTPTGLASSAITSTTATVSWGAVSGATGYNLQIRVNGTTTWTTFAVTANSANITGLTAGTTYQFQVQANCNGTLSSYSSIASFTTTAASCTDTYESNESRNNAKSIATNTNISAKIGTSTDKDWFRFTTTSSARNIRVTLDQLPADYDIRLYNSNGSQLAISQNGGTTAETIIRNTSSYGTYYLQVYGYNGAFNASTCYRLRVDVSSSSFKLMDGAEGEEEVVTMEPVDALSLFPNPTTGQFTVQLLSDGEDDAYVRVFDITGKAIVNTRYASTKGQNLYQLDLTNHSNGIYFVEVIKGDQRMVKKLVKE